MLAALAGCSPPTPDRAPGSKTPNPSSAPPTGVALQVIDLTNAERTRAGLSAVRASARLGEAARIQAEQVVAAGRLEHVLPDARYPRLEDRLDAAGYDWEIMGENLAFGQHSAAAVVNTWMQSPGHRANILNRHRDRRCAPRRRQRPPLLRTGIRPAQSLGGWGGWGGW